MQTDNNVLLDEVEITKKLRFKEKIKVLVKPFKHPLILFMLIFLTIICASYIYAFIWGLSTSLKSEINFLDDVFGFPKKLMWDNYAIVFRKMHYKITYGKRAGATIGFAELLWNNVLYSTFPMLIYLLSMEMCAYVVVKYNFGFNKVLNFCFMFTLVFPNIGSLGNRLNFLHNMGLYDSYWALLEGYIVFADYGFYLFSGVFKGIPSDYIEAAKIDGAGNFRIMFTIMFPMARVTFMVLLIQNFIAKWNTYQTALETMPSMPNLALALYSVTSGHDTEMSWQTRQIAASMLVSLPCVILFCIFEPWMVGDLTGGGIKG